MDEIVYNLLLKSAQGLTLLGTLRYRFIDQAAAVGDGGVPAMLAESLDRPTVEVVAFQLEGSISIPLLTGVGRIPLSGLAFATAAGPVTTLLGSSDPARRLDLQFNQITGTYMAGGLIWRPGEPVDQAFSVLGTLIRLGV